MAPLDGRTARCPLDGRKERCRAAALYATWLSPDHDRDDPRTITSRIPDGPGESSASPDGGNWNASGRDVTRAAFRSGLRRHLRACSRRVNRGRATWFRSQRPGIPKDAKYRPGGAATASRRRRVRRRSSILPDSVQHIASRAMAQDGSSIIPRPTKISRFGSHNSRNPRHHCRRRRSRPRSCCGSPRRTLPVSVRDDDRAWRRRFLR